MRQWVLLVQIASSWVLEQHRVAGWGAMFAVVHKDSISLSCIGCGPSHHMPVDFPLSILTDEVILVEIIA